MADCLRVVDDATAVVACVYGGDGLAVYRLVGRLRVQDETGHIRRPWIRLVALVPAQHTVTTSILV